MVSRKGGVAIHAGFGVLLLILIVLYVIIKLTKPELGSGIDTSLTNLSSAVSGLIPFT